MIFAVHIEHVQHVVALSLELDLASPKLTCLVGRNGVGKTTLVRALRNLAHADTFLRTAQPGIFKPSSRITYALDGKTVIFEYQEDLGTLNCKSAIPADMRSLCSVELAMPHGERFNYFRSISDIDRDFRHQIVLEQHIRPGELIAFLHDIYDGDKYNDLIEIRVKGKSYYGKLLPDGRYVREDYLSSAEYFLINLYRTMRSGAKLIVVDEIDLSLDAAAQVHLIEKIRHLCAQYGSSVLFTTHSLAMMRTLSPDELIFLEENTGRVTPIPASYAFINSVLFGFKGWDRYILVEDVMTQGFLQSFIQHRPIQAFLTYNILPIGGGTQVCDLLRRNRREQFLAGGDAVIAVLDGDRRDQSYANDPDVMCLPFADVEKALHADYFEGRCRFRLPDGKGFNGPKDLYNSLVRDGVASPNEIWEHLASRYSSELDELAARLTSFLGRQRAGNSAP